ncbi:WD repeat-containing protein 52, partial [Stegodyphus mimosarum]
MDAFSHLKVKPVCKPDVHLKKSRRRIFNENSVRLSYSFGYQSKICHNIAVLNERIIIIIAGNYLNFLDIETTKETFLPSLHGAGFGAIEAYPSEFIFAVAERGESLCINIYMYPDLKPFKTLKHEFTIMPSRLIKFHPNGELLISASDDPENKVIIYLWKKELVLYDANVTYPVYDIHYASWDFSIFVTSGIGHVRYCNLKHYLFL